MIYRMMTISLALIGLSFGCLLLFGTLPHIVGHVDGPTIPVFQALVVAFTAFILVIWSIVWIIKARSDQSYEK